MYQPENWDGQDTRERALSESRPETVAKQAYDYKHENGASDSDVILIAEVSHV